ncbi:MAG: gamma-glutamyl-gamma-aminobutyrate hydrolase family protein [Eubacterium sp.]
MKKRPRIGVLPLYDTKRNSKWNSLWMFPGYIDGIVNGGGMPYILPLLKDAELIRSLVSDFDGFLFTGGHDIDPVHYNQPMYNFCNEISPERDHMEFLLFHEARKQNKPLLGVCRGLQLFNVALGGTLYQDLDHQQQKTEILQHNQKTEFIFPVHDIVIEKNSQLFDIIGKKTISVNSMHHQGIANLAEKLTAVAYASDGLVEAVEISDMTYGLAIQWHPEFLWSKRLYEKHLFESFVNACTK